MPVSDTEILPSGHAHPGDLVRIGSTVRRPVGSYTPAVHAYLRHLEKVGFEGSPRVHGIDSEGREVLDFIPGDVPHSPLPAWAGTDGALASLARLLRRLHDAAASFSPPPEAVWHEPQPPMTYAGTRVCHNDLVPDNVVFRDGQAVAFIDFDLSAPVDPIWDVAVAIRHWLPVRAEPDLERAHLDREPGPRLALFCDAYGLSAHDRSRLLDAVLECTRYAHDYVQMKAAAGERAWIRAMAEGRCERHLRSSHWLTSNRQELQSWLRSGSEPRA
ncbi:MAG TPA: phosphotransferase [Actinomycetota bacterium]